MKTYYLAIDIGASSGRHILGYIENEDNANIYTKITTNNTRDTHYESIYNNESSKYNEFVFNRDALTFEEFISTFEVTTGKTETMHIVESLDTKVVSYNYEYSTYENSYLFETPGSPPGVFFAL